MVFSTGLGYQEAEGKKFSAGSWKLAWSGVINPHWKDGHARIHGEKISIEYQLVQRMLFDLRRQIVLVQEYKEHYQNRILCNFCRIQFSVFYVSCQFGVLFSLVLCCGVSFGWW